MRWRLITAVALLSVYSCGLIDREPEMDDDVTRGVSRLKDLRGDILFTVSPELDLATGLMRFTRNVNGKGFRLPETDLYMDGNQVLPDSTEMNGVFYEVQVPLSDFYREHFIEFRTANKAVHSEKFTVEPFAVQSFPESVELKDLDLTISGVPEAETVTVIMVDTVFTNNDLNRKYEVKDGVVRIPVADLQSISPGPISAEVLYENKLPAKVLPLKRGQITIRQGFKSEFQLKKQ